MLTSKDAHYSVKKAAFLLGIGISNLYLVDVDKNGRMDLVHLRQEVERALKENAKPFMVSATAGISIQSAQSNSNSFDIMTCRHNCVGLHRSSSWHC